VIPRECKRLAEVDFPIAEVSKHAVREKSIRHGHPSTLHLWWARRPLASCRAMLLALLLPDPCDPLCPADFKSRARELLCPLPNMSVLTDDDKGLRKGLLKFIADFANWDLASNQTYLETGRGLVKSAHPEETPVVVDPFAGGGSIPLEAMRLGCETFASDLNPVASLILKVMLEDIPRHGPELADELRRAGAAVRAQAEKELAECYPQDRDGARPMAYLWARTVRCEESGCGAEIPLLRSFWLSKRAKHWRALRYRITRFGVSTPELEFEVFQPGSAADVPTGTVSRARAKCPCCGTTLLSERVRAQLEAQRDGADVQFDANGQRTGGARLLAVVTPGANAEGRRYRLACKADYRSVANCQRRLNALLSAWESGGKMGPCPVPGELIHGEDTRNFWVCKYGATTFGDLFTARQKLALALFAGIMQQVDVGGSDSSVREMLAMVLSRSANAGASLCRWNVVGEKHEGVFARQALPMVWDFSEVNPLSCATGGYLGALEWVAQVVERWRGSNVGQTQCADATLSPLPEESASIWFTDPPYYDAVPYADLSDFFFVWLKRALPGHPLLRDPFDVANKLTPKVHEAVQNERSLDASGAPKGRAFYEKAMASAFAEGRRVLKQDGVGSVVFAHKTTEGWESLLSGLVVGRWTITASWPIATEMGARLRAQDSAALATSVHLVCRPRPEDAPVGDWGDVLRELPVRVGDWMERLQNEGVRGADLVFACVGPALEIYSRYSRVEMADGREVPLAEYLEKVWEVVGRTALGQILGTAEAKARNGMAGALEEDARLTAVFLWTLQSTNGSSKKDGLMSEEDTADEDKLDTTSDDDDEEGATTAKPRGPRLIYDMVIRFTRPLGIDLEKWNGRIVSIEKGSVRLIPVTERATQLFGEDLASTVREIERGAIGVEQLTMFPEAPRVTSPPVIRPRQRRRSKKTAVGDARATVGPTTLDRVHAAMLLQSSGQANALRALLKQEQERGQDFLRLANALSALYPRESEEKRLLDAMLLAVPR